ncbi:MAG: hypothetical protein ABFS03_04190 [Chloroflexota bacterium]
MQKKFYFGAIIAATLISTLACSVFSAEITPEASDNPIVSEPSEIPETPETPEMPSNVLFQDDFSDTTSGWDQTTSEEGMTDYENGYYRILVNTDDMDIWANPGLDFADVIVEVEASKAGGPDDNDFGVICRYQDVENFYFFIISSDGYYAVGKVVNGDQQLIGDENMNPSDDINQGAALNQIKADCVGSQLAFYVNGSLLTAVEDSTFIDGDVGLIAGTFSEVGTDIHFDNFSVVQP